MVFANKGEGLTPIARFCHHVIVLEVSVPRGWLRKSKKRLWYSTQDIPAERLGQVIDFTKLAASPVKTVA